MNRAMARLTIHRIPARKDNYLWLAVEPEKQMVAIVDPSDAAPVRSKLKELGLRLTHILNTHHHNDHIGGNLELKEEFGLTIIGPRADAERIPGIDVAVGDGDTVMLGNAQAKVFDVPGHTRGHIAYWFAESDALFCGDTLFAMGCGRLFEGTPEQMWNSLSKFRTLPDSTRIYCAHEYTLSNARFALTVDGGNPLLKDRAARVAKMRDANEPTVPSTLAEERATNPFLRADRPELAAAVGLAGSPPAKVFGAIRAAKDSFS
jgi:hydroxyacylglutathione hydrolase